MVKNGGEPCIWKQLFNKISSRMKKIGYVVRPYIHKSGRVMVRVRWNSSKTETVFSTECSADPEKWSKDANRETEKNREPHF